MGIVNVSPAEKARRMVFAREQAAQAWCAETTKHKVMDTDLAEAFAEILVKQMYAPHLGCATTRQIIEELSARSDLDYKTITEEQNNDRRRRVGERQSL